MKSIKITHYHEPIKSSIYTKDKSFNIYLGNGRTISFRDKKKLITNLYKVNKGLNEALQELVLIYNEIYREYWDIWFYLDSHVENTENRNNFKRIEALCLSSLHSIPPLFNLAVDRSHFQNGNHYAFQHLFHSVENLTYVTNMLIKLRRTKCHTAETNKLEVFLKKINIIKKDLHNL